MSRMTCWMALASALCLCVMACSESEPVAPVSVAPADGTPAGSEQTADGAPSNNPTTDAAIPMDTARSARRADDTATPSPDPDTQRPPLPGAGEVEGGGVWVVDSAGQDVGALVRRGSDDNLVYRAIYDLVTVYHPESGLFFEITMTDAVVRHPSTAFFATADCKDPVGISYGGCAECRSGPGTALFHEGVWYRVTPGVHFEVTTSGSTRGSGLEEQCSSHHTDSAKVFPVSAVGSSSPPTSFTPPLHFAWK